MTPLPLTLNKRASVLDGLVMIECVSVEKIKALLKSSLLLSTWGDDYQYDYHKKLIVEQYANEKVMIAKYLNNHIEGLGGVSVKYGKPKHKWGRSFPFKSLGLSCIRKVVRNSLIDGVYYDCDLKNCQPEIIRNLCESNDIPCPIVKRYCDDRANILIEVQNHYNVSRDTAKELFIRLCFFGSFVGWCLENKITNQTALEVITLFERELKDIAERLKKENPVLYETARKKKEASGESEKKAMGSFFALYNQEYESRIVEAVLCYLINHTDLMKLQGTSTPTGAYEYDGLKLLKANVDMYEGGLDAVLELLNEKTFELTGFRLEWASKPYEDTYDLSEWIEEVIADEAPNDSLIEDTDKILNAITNADVGIIETLMEINPNHYIYSVDKEDGSKGEWYGWNGVRWEKGDAPLRKAIIYAIADYWRGLMLKWDNIYSNKVFQDGEQPDCNYLLWSSVKKRMENRIFALKTSNGISACVSVAKTLMANYTLEFDTKPDLFGCENGVIDIANECFRPYRFDDFVTFSCGYDFTPQIEGFSVFEFKDETKDGETITILAERKLKKEDREEDFRQAKKIIKEIYEQIFPDPELRNYFFKVVSTGMSGRAIEKFFVFNGAGRNGKGLTNEFLEKVFGSYFASITPIIFSENQKNKSTAGANPEIAKLDKKRYVVTKEPQKNAPLHNNVIKDFTGGGNTSARMLYSSKTDVKLMLTLVMECNVKPPFSEAPKDADVERINDILFCSKFCATEEEWDETTGETNHIYPLDAGLKEELKGNIAFKNAMLNILLVNLLSVKNKEYNVDFFKPESVKQRSLEYLQNSYDIHTIFLSLFEKRCGETAKANKYLNFKGEDKDGDKDWSLPKIAGAIRKSQEFYQLSKTKQKEYKADYIEDFFRTNAFYKSSCYNDTHKHTWRMRDWRLKPEEEDNGEV